LTPPVAAALIWSVAGFVAGSIPFALYLGQAFAGVDIRRTGDGNPGAANLWRAAGWPLGILGLSLDFLKGAVPVGLAQFAAGLGGWALLPVAMAPILGHAYSPFLRFRGGKALLTTLGVWTGLTLGEASIIIGVAVIVMYLAIAPEGWAVVATQLVLLAFLIGRISEPVLLAVWLGSGLVLVERHLDDLRQPPRLRRRRGPPRARI
jgi:glycerol-3-phosphate acyltransferase PlsY